jgi:hypothetical protein
VAQIQAWRVASRAPLRTVCTGARHKWGSGSQGWQTDHRIPVNAGLSHPLALEQHFMLHQGFNYPAYALPSFIPLQFYHRPSFTMQAYQHLPLRGNSIQDIISSIRPDRVIYIRENADSPICPPPCECVDCQNQFYITEEQKQVRFSYKAQISDVEAREILKDYILRIRNNREFLQKQCAVYGDRILSRWRKKSREQRAACLLHAEPDLYPHQ